jgi:16S rRNA (uracil1498-N3)-methyltransferase
MKIRTRLYTSAAGESAICLDDEDTLDIRRSLRLKDGESIVCFNGDGCEYLYRIESVDRKKIYLALLDTWKNPLDDLPETTVFIALTKGKTKDQIVKELPPLGISKIVWFLSERSVCRWDSNQEERLRKIAIESCRQCGRSSIPQINILDNLFMDICCNRELIPEKAFLFWEERQKSNSLEIEKTDKQVALLFGPEGGFTANEIEAAIKNGIRICTLGKRILRSELAVVVGVTLVQAQRGVFTGE